MRAYYVPAASLCFVIWMLLMTFAVKNVVPIDYFILTFIFMILAVLGVGFGNYVWHGRRL